MNLAIIGADSTHTENFAGIINRGLAGPGLRVTRLWGANPDQAHAKALETGIDEVVDAPEQAMQDVDAVLVLNRWGPDHFAPAMQAVDLGLPLFVDKPLCDDPQEAVTLVRAAAAAGVPLTSASAVRYDRAIRQLLERLPDLGRTRSIMFTLPQNWQLYGVHAVDVMHAVFGVGAEDVTSVRGELGDVVTIRWPHGQVGIANQAREAWMGMLCVALGEKGWTHADMPGDDTIDGFPRMYLESIKQFLAMLETGERPISDAEMVDVIRVVAAAERSATSDSRRVPLSEMPAL
ncbi:MAG: Gfo/Idh/MocA family oxidoreductase [Chloroflexota bacterium]|nr:Gfo/Idh/MocA family oxidoreductase [Chloroflexota bacterium]MDE2918956.1 Gfo/Idh/MocA family oxidoreductase [Chloroflexota bacterium]